MIDSMRTTVPGWLADEIQSKRHNATQRDTFSACPLEGKKTRQRRPRGAAVKESRMNRHARPLAGVVCAATLLAGSALAHAAPPLDHAEIVIAAATDGASALPSAAPRSAVTVQGVSSSVRLDVHRATLEEILSALAKQYNLSLSRSIALGDIREGTYSGSLGLVISRLLDGYDYVIRRERDHLDLWVLGKSGEQATPSPTLMRARQHQVPTTTRISRNR
jgi:hypothetical protein